MKPRLTAWGLVGYIAVALQTTVVPAAFPGRLAPDLVLSVALFLAFVAPPFPALVWAWGLGLAKDVTGAGPIGGWALLFLAASAFVVAVRGRLFIRRAPTQMVLAGVVALPVNLTYIALRCGAEGVWPRPPAVLAIVLGGTAATAAATVAVAWLLGRLRPWMGLVEEPRIA